MNRIIVTLTLNPAVDKTVFVRHMRPGATHQVGKPLLDPAGKGINVARVANRLRCATVAFGLLAGNVGEFAARALEEEGVLSHFLTVPGETRLNVNVVDETTRSLTVFVDDGPAVSLETLESALGEMLPWLKAPSLLVLAGSLPAGAPSNTYATFIEAARSVGTLSVLDADGESLRLGVEARPYLIKPNLREAEYLLGRTLVDVNAAVDGARELASRGIEIVVISMGEEGAVCVQGDDVYRALPPRVEKRSAVGSGDSMVAGLVAALARGDSLEQGLRLGTAAGAATAMSSGTALASRADIERLTPQVRIDKLSK